MVYGFKKILLLAVLLLIPSGVLAQNKEQNIAIFDNVNVSNSSKDCRVFINGKLLEKSLPVYPEEAKAARIIGKVEVVVGIDEQGAVKEIEAVVGDDVFRQAAAEAAMKAKFVPPTCDGKPSSATGVITYNFNLSAISEQYFFPTAIEQFTDIPTQSNYYESLLFLTENYKLAFGYADKKFHPEMPLNKGDFVEFLKQTLDMLEKNAQLAGKDARGIGIYDEFNPFKLESTEFQPGLPYSNSYKALVEKYRIVLAEKDSTFDGRKHLTQNDVIEIWREIFGGEALPVNFFYNKQNDRVISRGDFAVFLMESLGYLTYKTLP